MPPVIFPMALILGLLFSMGGCSKHVETGPEVAPILPAPEAVHYAVVLSQPRDPMVAQVAKGLPWDESLSGAATALVLDDNHQPSLARAHWAAVRAGYPYPVVGLSMGEVPAGETPTGLVEHLQEMLGPNTHLGLVRARVSVNRDRWLALVGQAAGTLGNFPREVELGSEFHIHLEGGGSWRALSPSGWRANGALPVASMLAEAGEWWFEVVAPDGTLVASLPVYVGMVTPKASIFDLPGEAVATPAELDVLAKVNHVRSKFSRVPVRWDDTLGTLAEVPLVQLQEGTWDREAGEVRLQGAGFVGGAVHQVHCEAPTLATCLDGLMRTIDGREALLDAHVRVMGHGVELSTDGLRLVLNFASE